VNNASYLQYVVDCDAEMAATHGWPSGRSSAADYAIAPTGYRIEYQEPALFGDDLDIVAWHSAVGADRLIRHYHISQVASGRLLTRIRAELRCVEPISGGIRSLPRSFLESVTSLSATEPAGSGELHLGNGDK
jgi:acyl-CoA thioesterase FadM